MSAFEVLTVGGEMLVVGLDVPACKVRVPRSRCECHGTIRVLTHTPVCGYTLACRLALGLMSSHSDGLNWAEQPCDTAGVAFTHG